MTEISVILPAYNAEKTIQTIVESVLAQSFFDFELIIINDGSIDSTGVVSEKYAEIDFRINVIHTKNMGVAAARNMGIKNSCGKYIYFVDSDDRLMPGALMCLHDMAKMSRADIVIADYVVVDIRNNSIKRQHLSLNQEDAHDILSIKKKIYKQFYSGNAVGLSSVCNKLFRANMMIKNKVYFDERRTHGEDWAFFIDALENSSSIALIDKVVYEYRINGSQVPSKYKKNLAYCYIDGHERIKRTAEKYKLEISSQEIDNFEIIFFKQFMEYIGIADFDKDDVMTHLKNKTIEAMLLHIINMSRASLRDSASSRRQKLTALLLYFKLPRIALYVYRSERLGSNKSKR